MRENDRQTRIAIIDDHRLFSSGLAAVLAGAPLGAEVEVFDDPRGFLEALRRPGIGLRFDMVMLDLFIPGFAPEETVRAVRQALPEAAILMVSGSISMADVNESLAAGADHYLPKTTAPDQLIETAAALLAGERRTATPPAADAAEAVGLSPRQLEILRGAARGQSNKELARILEVSPETIKTHLATIFRRLDVRNRIEAVDAARAQGIA